MLEAIRMVKAWMVSFSILCVLCMLPLVGQTQPSQGHFTSRPGAQAQSWNTKRSPEP